MSQNGVELGRESISCSVCLDLLKDPVTIPCGHSYCMSCINTHWDQEDEKRIYSCPQCRQTFRPRPVLVRNIMLADLVEQLKKTGLQAAPADHCFAGAEDVACDVCTGRKRKAEKTCLVCLASYCEKHLQLHKDVPPLKKHKLVDPMKKLQENICSRHHEVMKMFCRTDQQCICCLCSVDEHKGHDTVSAAAERTERQRELELRRQQIHQRVEDREKDEKLREQEMEAIFGSVNEATKAIDETSELLTTLRQQVMCQCHGESTRVEDLQQKLEQEITELLKQDAELKQLSHTEDHNQFLHNYPSLPPLSPSTHSSSINVRPLKCFEVVTAAVSEIKGQIQDVLTELEKKVKLPVNRVHLPLAPSEPKTRAGFLKYSRKITLDPNTACTGLCISEEDRHLTMWIHGRSYDPHPDRFTLNHQALSRESLTGRCYWEVEFRGEALVAVAYRDIVRKGGSQLCGFGQVNQVSWALRCCRSYFEFMYNNDITRFVGPVTTRVGVYLDHSAGVLSFYSVKHKTTLLHRVRAAFTQPLHAGFGILARDHTLEICELE